ncbi:YraN family protein [Paraburkholderia sp. SARCC-3016]|uniref:YraN family protein n=1 Tax=Paraburkholderia sp. SARCC-3016 TaxID=3058611 RepID=UPI0028081519|nr:YraN family protein [Paraburkholderia sp. SARCC-3016]MDQ7979160.1 YraN family protein [Paraburkholderia sp. SARCC-3016]
MRLKTQTDGRSTPLCHHADGGKAAVTRAGAARIARSNATTASIGAKFEAHALAYLQRQRLRFVARNVMCRGGEIDLVMRDGDGTLVFVEVRARARTRYGGASASVGRHKRERLVRAAQYYLAQHPHEAAACRFDVVAFEAGRLVWLRDAFRADDS